MAEPTGAITFPPAPSQRRNEPNNCRWVPRKDQCRNRRSNRVITAWGVSRTVAEWSEVTDIHRNTISARIDKQGKTPEEALTPTVKA